MRVFSVPVVSRALTWSTMSSIIKDLGNVHRVMDTAPRALYSQLIVWTDGSLMNLTSASNAVTDRSASEVRSSIATYSIIAMGILPMVGCVQTAHITKQVALAC